MGFYSNDELCLLGFKYIGNNVLISKKASIYGAGNIIIGNNSRIDDFVLLSAGSGGITIGDYVHIAANASIIGAENVTLSDYSGISSRVSIYSSTDDYSGEYMTNPCLPNEFRNVISLPVFIGKHVIVGVGSSIMPGISIGNGTAVGAHSFINKSLPENIIVSGVPARKIGERLLNIYDLETKLLNKYYEG